MKGYIAKVGYKVKSACMFNYFLKEQEAREWIKEQLKIFLSINPKLKAEGKIEKTTLKKCKNSYCKDLLEVDFGEYCLKCEDLIQEARTAFLETK